ncbi:hypothetical protein M948_11670 [Virgibacillus sp. CM-4]|nr:hypothetical protein M948_11670 [Virgibacillus sp. CM-4]
MKFSVNKKYANPQFICIFLAKMAVNMVLL